DVDDFYWKKTEPPFQTKIPLAERNAMLWKAFNAVESSIVSGSLVSWGALWETAFDLAIFLRLPAVVRMERLRARERFRHGEKLETDETVKSISKAFLEWASHYDNPIFKGRSLAVHKRWMEKLTCPVLEISGDLTNDERKQLVLQNYDRDLRSF
ncbi:MAG: hypothetical protein AAF960_21260, partial [Bacteroidota bacterium]